MRKLDLTAIIALVFSIIILVIGYITFGIWPTLLFSLGFIGGWIAWMLLPTNGTWKDIKVPYFLTLLLFIGHRVEEKVMDFFPALQEITGVPTPDILAPQVIGLVLTSVGAWLAIPFVVARNFAFGYYLAWTFFVSMGVTELAHYFFPFVTGGPYGYFPGMASVLFLAPVAWWGMVRLSRGSDAKRAAA